MKYDERALYELLRFGRKHSGPWDDGELPDETRAGDIVRLLSWSENTLAVARWKGAETDAAAEPEDRP